MRIRPCACSIYTWYVHIITKDRPLTELYSVNKKSGVRVPPDGVVFPLFLPRVEKGKSGGENHDKRTLGEGVEGGVNHLSKITHD